MKSRRRAFYTILLSLVAMAAGLSGCLGAGPQESGQGGQQEPPVDRELDEQPCVNHHITMQYEGESLTPEGLEEAFQATGWGYQPAEGEGGEVVITPQAPGIEVTAFHKQDEPVRTVVINVEEGAGQTGHLDRVESVAMEASQQINATFPDAQLTLWEVGTQEAC